MAEIDWDSRDSILAGARLEYDVPDDEVLSTEEEDDIIHTYVNQCGPTYYEPDHDIEYMAYMYGSSRYPFSVGP